ncbi:universal stress protein [Cryobacterium sp.]|jgi:nucleotide-binding universal stress UspA family protein|uniref:universal stress protein n=1 Tax=Cryobacterium sp. TaxID=1926290 RepID=UPI00262BD3A7|nr:universal stress protein [Cryobacterium sp.]MCU1445503.1 universal stress protein UspA [Cryobacterium sp.]
MDADTGQGGGAARATPGDAAAVHAEAAGHPPQQPGPRSGIVVGHDGSADANHALGVALELAAGLAVPVTVVRAWSIDTAPRPANWEFGYVSSYSDYAGAVTERLQKDTRALVAAHPALAVEYRVALGGPAKTLIEVSKGSRMLVVGSRGRGGLAGMLLGSVSEQCVRHAECPVLVVPPLPKHS